MADSEEVDLSALRGKRPAVDGDLVVDLAISVQDACVAAVRMRQITTAMEDCSKDAPLSILQKMQAEVMRQFGLVEAALDEARPRTEKMAKDALAVVTTAVQPVVPA